MLQNTQKLSPKVTSTHPTQITNKTSRKIFQAVPLLFAGKALLLLLQAWIQNIRL